MTKISWLIEGKGQLDIRDPDVRSVYHVASEWLQDVLQAVVNYFQTEPPGK